jgi:hypothetical protein
MWEVESELNQLESWAIDRDSRVSEVQDPLEGSQVARCKWNSVRICPDHRISLNTPWQPIVNKYREGKVKSTPARGVK